MKSVNFLFLVAASLALCVVPVRVCAEPVPYEGGDDDGEYSIGTFDQLERFAVMLQDYSFPDSTFTLIADIDCEGRALPTGEFAGTFDGQGNVISNLVVEAEGDEPAGLFGSLIGTVQDVIIVNPVVKSGRCVGALAGEIADDARVSRCGVIGASVTASGECSGAFAGQIGGGAQVSECFAAGTVSSAGNSAGGFVGYVAECNVGAATPEESGYYFWWGDTVGYTRSGGTLTSNFIHHEYYTGVTWVSSTGIQMGSSPFDYESCPTYEMENAEFLSEGYIDSTTNLVAAHDAATAHLGAPWRMPTSAEIEALVSNCTTTWITTNGANGRLVTGKGAYANRSIFLPAAGYGSGSSFYDPGSQGDLWASTPISDFSYNAWRLNFNSSNFRQSDYSRYLGQPVRPVRDPAD